ncbi:hypothetical protein ACQKOM_04860 [Peribacillus frigoritolerans]
MNREMVSKFNPEILMELVSRLMSTLVEKKSSLPMDDSGRSS